MRLIRLQLKRSVPFWYTSYAKLNAENPISGYIDIDDLSERQIKVITESMKSNEISVLDRTGNIVRSITDTSELNEFLVSNEELEEEEDIIPEVQSVTVSLDEDDEIEEEPLDREEIKEESLIVINKNGNTVKKTLLAIDVSEEKGKALLHACLQSEIETKNRPSIIDTINKILGDC